MVEFIKSTVKCYKKKTKKMVGGHKKTYEYNQYQVPLKRSDNLVCSEEVYIIPQDLFHEIQETKSTSQDQDIKQHRLVISEYEKELADIEWKHKELSRSYKALVSKNAKTNKRLKMEEEKTELFETLNTTLKEDNRKLFNQLQELKEQYHILKETADKQEDKDQDIWKSIRSRFTGKEEKDQNNRE